MISWENFSAELWRAGSLEEVVKCFEKYNSMEKENLDSWDRSLIETQHIPNYTFVINSDMFGQTNQSLMNTWTISYSWKLKSVAMDQEWNSISYEYFEYNKDWDQYKIEDSQNDPTSNRRWRQDEDKKREEIAETLEKVKTNRDDRKNG
jgi:Asp-tRNA(Asn)/Glu-tRNA(Gln) amidotransferase C subunit